MKIKDVTKSTVYYVTTDEDEFYEYVRHSAIGWGVVMGESEEPVYDCEELEDLFQASLKEEGKEKGK